MTPSDILDRAIGAMIGLAVGDALGTTVEFKSPGSFAPVNDIIGGGPFKLEPGQWTDDTSMALCLAESLIECKGFDPQDQMERYLRWWHEGHLSSNGRCFDIGNTVRNALSGFQRSGNPFSGATDEHSAGNGCIMRLAPIPIAFRSNPRRAIQLSGESSRTTHGALACVDACRYMAGLIVGAIQGVPKAELLGDSFAPLGTTWEKEALHHQIATIAAGSFKRKEPPAIRGTGFVVESLEAALWAFYKTDNFRDGALLSVNLGDDADTTGAVYGQIAGAYYGHSGIPADWSEKIALRETVLRFAQQLFDLSVHQIE